ncbi:AraC family transcriptional regulator [Bacillus salacetis]|uniref:AraC family transcriptional regulator n=1 Tax=Bacillus salacetis TaxID=2315464 RepID=A0A3A1R8W8_9BACI|nr:GyrI-like domain-containing protein [Bacillus salacetis]RIW38352.1 AraC family transcriptional regulator [Bacillus salacetis]
MKIELKELPQYNVAFIRQTGSYFGPQEHWGELINWAVSNGLYPPEQSFIGISLDNPDLVNSENCRHDACVTIPEGFNMEEHKEMKFKKVDGGKYAAFAYYDTPESMNSAYQFMFSQWLPNSEYEADYGRQNLEFNLNNPSEDPEGKCRVDLYIPVKGRE